MPTDIADIPAMSHMLPLWMCVGLTIFDLCHVVAYTGIPEGIRRVISQPVRIRDFLKFFGWFVLWCGQTHSLMIACLWWGGWWYGAYFLVSGISGLYSFLIFGKISASLSEIHETLEIGDREQKMREVIGRVSR